ncbi:MAG: translocation/assembly module TamB domain-containing protein [Gemmatimonadota bacterium]|nr:translocation/assembly module TamB domain-containing protein [Gemmatimonadota bacterium]
MRKVLAIVAGVIVTLVVLVVAAIGIITNSDWGHERVRRFALGALGRSAHGIVRIGKVGGNLLSGTTVSDISITDSAGNPFIAVDSMHVSYRIGAFLRKRIDLSDVRLVDLTLVLDKRSGGDWNYKRIFASDSTGAPSTGPGFGSWIDLRRVTMVNSRILVRTPWAPSDSLTGAARDSVIAFALSADGRTRVERAGSGFQQIMDFRGIDASMPRLRLADPDSATRIFDVASLHMVAEPFRPPVATVRELKGTFFMLNDSLWFRGMHASLESSRISGDGTYLLTPGDIALALHADTLALADLRWLYPRLPSSGGGTLDFAMRTSGKTSDFNARRANLATQGSTISGDFGLALSDTIAFHDTNLKFANFDTRLIEQLVPGLKSPRRGTLGGRTTLAGSTRALRIDSDVAFDDTRSGRSRVVAAGEIGFAKGFSAKGLHLRVEPVQVDLARIAMPTLPIGGTVTGTATIDGSVKTQLVATGDLVHSDRGELSHLTGRATIARAGTKRMDVDIQARPLALATVGRFAPAAGLTGAVTGPIRVHGNFDNLVVDSDLRLPDGGAIITRGALDIASAEKGYDLSTRMTVFNLRSVTTKAPPTSLTAVATAKGRGFAPATMRAAFAADLQRSQVDSVGIDTLHLRVAVAAGMATVDSTSFGTSFARAVVSGTFGLAAGQQGALAYTVQVDSLDGVRRWLPKSDTVVITPRPGRLARALEQAHRDSIAIARRNEIAIMATGHAPSSPKIRVDSIPPVRADSLSGSVYAAGVLRGNLTNFDMRGRASVDRIVARGNTIRRGKLEYAWTSARTPDNAIVVAATVDSAQAFGLALDSMDVRFAYQRDSGHVDLVVVQDTGIRYAASVDLLLHSDHSELHLRNVALQFDTTVWRSVGQGAVHWGPSGIDLRAIDLRSKAGGRMYANGLIPTQGVANVDIAVEGFDIANLVALTESDLPASGILTTAAHIGGTRENPLVHGALGMSRVTYRGTPVPDIRARFDYADRSLAASAEMFRAGKPLASATAKLPIDLALAGVTGPRMLDLPMTFDLQADSLPLDVLPRFTESIADLQGRMIGRLAARGTMKHPRVAGQFALDLGSLRIVSTGTRLSDITGMIRMAGDSVFIDSIVGHAGGQVRLSGTLGIASLAEPSFALSFDARDARLLDNEQGHMNADVTVSIAGPFNGVSITGVATIRYGVFYIPESTGKKTISSSDPILFIVADTSVASERELLPSESAMTKNLQVNVGVQILSDTWVRSTDGNIELFTPPDEDLAIRVNRTQNAVVLTGVLATERGEYAVAGRRFQITRGTITFIGDQRINPLLQLAGEHEVQIPGREAMAINVLIGGTLHHPRITLESNAQPPISQSDLLSYLAFGRSSSSLLTQEGSSVSGAGSASGGLAGTVAGLAARQLAGVALGEVAHRVAGEAARSLGADYFNITPADVPAELSSTGIGGFLRGTEFELGKYTSRDTFVGLQARPAPDAVPGIRVEQRMSAGFRLEASFEPRYLLRDPTLSTTQPPVPTGVFGLFLIREVRW